MALDVTSIAKAKRLYDQEINGMAGFAFMGAWSTCGQANLRWDSWPMGMTDEMPVVENLLRMAGPGPSY